MPNINTIHLHDAHYFKREAANHEPGSQNHSHEMSNYHSALSDYHKEMGNERLSKKHDYASKLYTKRAYGGHAPIKEY